MIGHSKKGGSKMGLMKDWNTFSYNRNVDASGELMLSKSRLNDHAFDFFNATTRRD
jgi:hypothetical protein